MTKTRGTTETKRVSVPEPLLKLLLEYFATGVGKEGLADAIFKALEMDPNQGILPENTDDMIRWALENENGPLAQMIQKHLESSHPPIHLFRGQTFKQRAKSIGRYS